jgi:uncharacterized membrane protein
MEQFKAFLKRLKKPSVLLSIASQGISIGMIFGLKINQQAAMGVVTGIVSLLVTLGILSNPDNKKIGYTDHILMCSRDKKKSLHTWVNGKLVCTDCGAVYGECEDGACALTGKEATESEEKDSNPPQETTEIKEPNPPQETTEIKEPNPSQKTTDDESENI